MKIIIFYIFQIRHTHRLFLQHNRIVAFEFDCFKSLKFNLRWLDLSYNLISSVDKEIQKLPALRILDLSYNKIEILNFNSSQFRVLKHLRLHGNYIRAINIPNRLLFPGLSSLSLSLYGRSVFRELSYPPAVFNSISYLKLELTNSNDSSTNNLISNWLRNFQRLENVSFSYNSFNVINVLNNARLPKLQHISAMNSNLTQFPEFSSFMTPRLQAIDVSHNELQTLTASYNETHRRIREVYVSHNHIRSVKRHFIDCYPELTLLDLSHNELTTLNDDILRYSPATVLYLYDNRWRCDCHMDTLRKALIDNTLLLSEYDLTHGFRCETPSRLHNQLITNLEEEDLLCTGINYIYL